MMKGVFIFSLCFVSALAIPGGWSNLQDATAKVQELADKIRDDVGRKLTIVNFPEFKVVSYKTQVVAGTNYLLKIKAGDSYLHVKVWKRLDGNLVVSKVERGHTATDALE